MEYEGEIGKKKLTEDGYERFVSERLEEYYSTRVPIDNREKDGPRIDTDLLRLYRNSD